MIEGKCSHYWEIIHHEVVKDQGSDVSYIITKWCQSCGAYRRDIKRLSSYDVGDIHYPDVSRKDGTKSS